MSENNNSPEHVDRSVTDVRERADFEFWQATQGVPTDWFDVS
jgi:hypothetical protein